MAQGGFAKEVAMAASVIVLLLLIIVTPTLMGKREADISALPQVVVDRVDEETRVYVSGALSNYRYARIQIVAHDIASWEERGTLNESEVYSSRLLLKGDNGTSIALWVLVLAVDVEFEYNATIEVLSEESEDSAAELSVQVLVDDSQHLWEGDAPFTDFIPRREEG